MKNVIKGDVMINTTLIINDKYIKTKRLEFLDKGTWFIYQMPDGSDVVAIKSDDTVYDGAKFMCMRIEPSCGTIARLNKELEVSVIETVYVKYK